jgi:hypothetical protein
MSDDTLRIVRTFPNDVEADLAHAVLDAHGIDSVIIRDSAGGMLPWLNTLHPVRLAVRPADAELAERLLDGEDDGGGGGPDGGSEVSAA